MQWEHWNILDKLRTVSWVMYLAVSRSRHEFLKLILSEFSSTEKIMSRVWVEYWKSWLLLEYLVDTQSTTQSTEESLNSVGIYNLQYLWVPVKNMFKISLFLWQITINHL